MIFTLSLQRGCMLVLSRHLNQTIMIGDDIEISVVDIKGDQVRIGIKAPKDVKVYRKEIYDAITSENIDAASNQNIDIKNLESLIKDKLSNENNKKDNK